MRLRFTAHWFTETHEIAILAKPTEIADQSQSRYCNISQDDTLDSAYKGSKREPFYSLPDFDGLSDANPALIVYLQSEGDIMHNAQLGCARLTITSKKRTIAHARRAHRVTCVGCEILVHTWNYKKQKLGTTYSHPFKLEYGYIRLNFC